MYIKVIETKELVIECAELEVGRGSPTYFNFPEAVRNKRVHVYFQTHPINSSSGSHLKFHHFKWLADSLRTSYFAGGIRKEFIYYTLIACTTLLLKGDVETGMEAWTPGEYECMGRLIESIMI